MVETQTWQPGNATAATLKPVLVLLQLFQENLSPLFNKTLAHFNLTDPLEQSNLTEAAWIEAQNMHAINGMMYCWLPGLIIPSNATG